MKATVVFGGQFGSEGKGLLASYLALKERFTLCTTDAGPNAGHTAVMPNGDKVVTFHLPMAGVLSPQATIWLNGGAVINPEILMKEIRSMEDLGFNIRERLKIHFNAALITSEDILSEKISGSAMSQISSTQKGVGAAAVRRMLRKPGTRTAADYDDLRPFIADFSAAFSDNVCVEVAQGFSLNINSMFYPFTTFRCCNPAQGLMNAGLPTTIDHDVWAVLRTNPIRVGSLPNSWSGDVFGDQEETTWEELRQEPQYTTVTNRMRRVFTYSFLQVEQMIRETRPSHVLLNFAQYATVENLNKMVAHICDYSNTIWGFNPIVMGGFGPRAEDVKSIIMGQVR